MPAAKIKFGIDGVGEELKGYDGKPPTPGTYMGMLKRLEYTKTKGGEKPGTPMLKAMVEIIGPTSAKAFHGAGVWRNLVITDKTVGFINQFLNSLTDGSQGQIRKIQESFWNDGVTVAENGHVLKIGPFKIASPDGTRPVIISVKNRTHDGETRAEINHWIKKTSDEADELTDEEADAVDDVSDGDIDDDEGTAAIDDDVDNIEDADTVEIDESKSAYPVDGEPPF